MYYMKKLLILLLVLSFSFVNVSSTTFDFELTKNLGNINVDENIKAVWNSIEEKWEIMYIDSNKDIIAKSFDSTFIELDSDSETCGLDTCEYGDCNYVIADERYWICIADESGGTHDAYIFRYDFDGTGFTTLDTEQRSNTLFGVRVPAVANRYADADTGNPLILWDNLNGFGVRDEDLRYTISNDFQGFYPSTFSGDGAFNLPTTYETPDDVQVAWCNGAYHVLLIKDGGLFDIVYDDNEDTFTQFKNQYSMSPSFDGNITTGNYSVTSIDDVLYLAVTGEIGGVKKVSLQAWACNDDFTLTNVYTENINQDSIRTTDTDFYDDNNAVLIMNMEDSSSPINDDSGFSNSGVYNGVQYQQTGKYNYGLGFDGVDDFVNVSDSSSLTISDNSISIETWFKINELPEPSGAMMFVKRHSGGNGFALQYANSSGVYRLKFTVNANNLYENIVLENDMWYHLVAVYDGSNQIMYLNGTALSGGIAYSSAIGNANDNAYIGQAGTGVSYLNGYLDEVIIYDDALTPMEVNERYEFYSGEIIRPFLTKNSEDVYHLFYEELQSSNHYLKVSYENPCSCSSWVNTTTCVEDRVLQTRTCNPTLCENDLEARYQESVYCARKLNQTLGIYEQRTESYSDQSSCETEWLEVGSGVATCYPNPIDIPIDCQNIETWIEAIPVFESFRDSGCSEGNYHLTTCNPSYDCFNQNVTCEQLNFTQTDYSYDYIIGDTVTGKSSMSVDNACRCEWLFWDYGVKKFKLRSSLNLNCEVPCKEEWTCINEDYRALKHIDCSITNITLCDFGCSNNACDTAETGATSPLNPNFWLELFTNPSRTTKFVLSLFGSVLIGVFLYSLGNGANSSNKELMFMVGFGIGFAFFVLIGWIPAIIIFIIIFFVGLSFLFKSMNK